LGIFEAVYLSLCCATTQIALGVNGPPLPPLVTKGLVGGERGSFLVPPHEIFRPFSPVRSRGGEGPLVHHQQLFTFPRSASKMDSPPSFCLAGLEFNLFPPLRNSGERRPCTAIRILPSPILDCLLCSRLVVREKIVFFSPLPGAFLVPRRVPSRGVPTGSLFPPPLCGHTGHPFDREAPPPSNP